MLLSEVQADRYGTSLSLDYPNSNNSAGLAAPLYALAGSTHNFSLSFEGASRSDAVYGSMLDASWLTSEQAATLSPVASGRSCLFTTRAVLWWAGWLSCASARVTGTQELRWLLYAGSLNVPPGPDVTFTFVLESDDGSLLYIDGVLVVDNGGMPSHSHAVYHHCLSAFRSR